MWTNEPWTFVANETWSNGGYSTGPGPDDVTPLYPFLAFLLWCSFVVAAVGNVSVLMALANDDSKRDGRTKLFVGGLTISALVLTSVSTWALAVTMVTASWRFGIIGCKVITFVRNMYAYVSACFLAAVSVDRYVVLKRPYQPVISIRSTWTTVIAIFLVNVVLVLPRVGWAYTETFGADHVVVCVDVGIDLIDPLVAAVHGFVCRLLCFFVPLTIAWAAYVGIGVSMLGARDAVAPDNAAVNQGNEASMKTTRIGFIVLLLFTVLTTPFEINQMYIAAGSNASLSLMGPLFFVLTVGSVLPPIVYCIAWQPFRVMVRRMLPCSQATLAPTHLPHAALVLASDEFNKTLTHSRLHVRSSVDSEI